MTITCCKRKLIGFKWNLSQGKSLWSSWFHLYILFLKLMSVPVRDGIIDLNQIRKHYTFYSKMHFSGIQLGNASLTGNAGWGWRGWKLFLPGVQAIATRSCLGAEAKVAACNRIIASLRNQGSVASGETQNLIPANSRWWEITENKKPVFLEEHFGSVSFQLKLEAHWTNKRQRKQRCV